MRCLLILFFALQSVLPITGESLKYEIRYKLGIMNTRVASAIIKLNPDNWKDQPALYSEASVQVAPVFRLFLSEKYYAYLYLSNDEKKPIYYYNLNKKGYTDCQYSPDIVHYERHIEENDVRIYDVPNDGLTMEIFSMLFFVRDVELSPGQSMKMKTYLYGDFRNTNLKMLGKDNTRFPGRTADAFVVEMPEKGLMENGSGNSVYIWRDSKGTRPVLGIEIPLNTGTMIANLTDEL